MSTDNTTTEKATTTVKLWLYPRSTYCTYGASQIWHVDTQPQDMYERDSNCTRGIVVEVEIPNKYLPQPEPPAPKPEDREPVATGNVVATMEPKEESHTVYVETPIKDA